jgi:DNA-binding CsgD family transcriptional regulator
MQASRTSESGVASPDDPEGHEQSDGAVRADDGQPFCGIERDVVWPLDGLLHCQACTRRLVSEFARLRPTMPARPEALSELTPRETEVLRLMAEGLSNGEIAERLVVSDETVKTHVSRVLSKLGVRDRTQAVVVAYESGLVTPRAREPVE